MSEGASLTFSLVWRCALHLESKTACKMCLILTSVNLLPGTVMIALEIVREWFPFHFIECKRSHFSLLKILKN